MGPTLTDAPRRAALEQRVEQATVSVVAAVPTSAGTSEAVLKSMTRLQAEASG